MTARAEVDPANGLPERLLAQTASGQTIQNLEYGWDSDEGHRSRELQYRRDHVHDQFESFSYFPSGRLREAAMGSGPEVDVEAFEYNVFGDIRSRTSVGSMQYEQSGRLREFGPFGIGTSVIHDDAGRVRRRGNAEFTYNALDQVTSIEVDGSEPRSLHYDAQGSRVVRLGGAEGGARITIGDLYERTLRPDGSLGSIVIRVTTGDGRLVGQKRSEGLTGDPRSEYFLPDLMGSGSVTTDESGSVVAEVAYGPLGRPRDPTNWTRALAAEDVERVGLGFTGHRASTEEGFIDMRGRIADPDTARFLSPDPTEVVNKFETTWHGV